MRIRSPDDAYDVIVVGGGPAGAVSAMQLARCGHRVALLDRGVSPREKPCGDCLSPECARVLDRLGVLGAVEALEPARLDGWRIWSPDGTGFAGGFARAAAGDARVRVSMAVSRDRLDHVLLEHARAAGAEVHAPLHVERLLRHGSAVCGVVARDGDGAMRRLEARLVIGADGLRSVVARRVGATGRPGRLRKLSLTLHPRLGGDFTGGFGEMHVVEHGCVGIAPTGMGGAPIHNVTFVIDAAARRRDIRRDPTAVMVAMVRAAPGLASRADELFAAIADCGPPLASGPFDRPVRFTVADGVALVGDAAGYYDPFTGQGIHQALVGAERCAAVVDQVLGRERGAVVTGASLRPYARWVRASRRPARRVQQVIEHVTARPRMMNRFADALSRAPAFADALVATTGDIAPVRALAGAPLAQLGRALLAHRSPQ